MSMINKIILSPPFSNIYPKIKGTSKIVGTYTKNKRPGLHRVITTLRYKNRSIYNNVGLRNPGIDKVKSCGNIVSISLFEKSDWIYIKNTLLEKENILGIEFNISCPNANISNVNRNILEESRSITENIIVKLPHDLNLDDIKKYEDIGANFFHISNTKKTDYGAMSGKKLKTNNLSLISEIKNYNENIKIIGGGGIYSIEDLNDYKIAGSDYFSLSTILLNPFRTYSIINHMSQYQQLDLDHNI